MRVLTSHRLEDLLDALVAHLRDEPLGPLRTETIVVPGLGMARWLELRLAERLGIAAGIELPLLGSFLHRLTTTNDAAADPFAREVLGWRIWRLLGEHRNARSSPFGAAADYCRDDPDGRKRLQLCARLAGCFDEYQLYRDDLLLGFARGEDHKALSPHAPWQAALWRALLEDAGVALPKARPRKQVKDNHQPLLFGPAHEERIDDEPRGDGVHRLAELRRNLDDDAWRARHLPERLSVFGPTTMPPAFLALLEQLSRHLPVQLFVPQPTPHYFGHLKGKRSQAGENALLQRFGSESREFQELLVDLQDRGVEHEPLDDDAIAVDDAPPADLLRCLQQDIVQMRDRGERSQPPHRLSADDDSLRVHDCHSPQRELEVVRDQILRAFDRDPSLEPADVLVLVPDIDRYAPYAHAVFGPLHQHVPFHVADRSPARELPVCRALLAVLDLAAERLTLADVLHLLETTAVQRRFGLFPADLPHLRYACHAAGIRWGRDADSRHRDFDVPPFEQNSWQQGLDRLLLGTLTGPSDALFAGLLPVGDTTEGRSERLLRFTTFVRALFEQVEALRRPQPLAAWADRVDELLAALFAADDAEHEEARQKLQRATVDLRTQAEAAAMTEAVELPVLRDWLDQALAAGVSARGFLGGAVTVAAMLPMRAVPVRQLFVCGLDDESFPRRDAPPPFDLIAAKARPGDRSRRLDDRQMFLDLLLSARERLHLCYVGRSAKDNAEAAPSVVLSELLEHVERTCRTDDGRKAREHVVVRHPLQPWSTRYARGGDPRLFTYARQPAPTSDERTDERPWCEPGVAVLPPPDDRGRLELDALETFWWNPCRAFLQQALRVRVRKEDEREEQDEPFALDALARYQLQDDAVRRVQHQQPEHDDLLAIQRARGVLPVGARGDVAYGALLDDTEVLLGEARRFADGRSRSVDVTVDGCRIVGDIDGFTDDGLVYLRVAKLKPKDRMRAWLRHLIVTVQRAQHGAAHDDPWPTTTRVLASDGSFRYAEVPADEATNYLAALLQLRVVGMQRPLPFFERGSFECARRLDKRGADAAAAVRAAQKLFDVTEPKRPWDFDGSDQAIVLCMRGHDPFADGEQSEFFQLARDVWKAPISYLHEEDR